MNTATIKLSSVTDVYTNLDFLRISAFLTHYSNAYANHIVHL
jgi:hypothetical protein